MISVGGVFPLLLGPLNHSSTCITFIKYLDSDCQDTFPIRLSMNQPEASFRFIQIRRIDLKRGVEEEIRESILR